MELLLIIVPFAASLLTFFCGFGLGTLLLPVFLFFFAPGTAIALTALVHFLNSIFKFILLRKYADYNLVWTFGMPSIIGAVAGSLLSVYLDKSGTLFSYSFFGEEKTVTWIGFVIGLLLIAFALLELNKISIAAKASSYILVIGGIASGLFGGLSGHQGAVRTAFLTQAVEDKTILIATNTALAMLVDLSRIPVYGHHFLSRGDQMPMPWLILSIASAWCGAIIGNMYLRKINLRMLDFIMAVALSLFGAAMMLGMI